MIDIALGNYSGAAVHIGLNREDEPSYAVRLELDIEDPRELHTFWRTPSKGIEGILDASRQVLERGGANTVKIEREQLAELVAEIDRLREILDSPISEHALELYPDEARAAAAMLRHYAKGVERR